MMGRIQVWRRFVLVTCIIIGFKNTHAGVIDGDSIPVSVSSPGAVSILGDKTFSNGFEMLGTNTANTVRGHYLYRGNKKNLPVFWRLAEWGSRYPINTHRDVTMNLNGVAIRNKGKQLTIQQKQAETIVTMALEGGIEFEQPRKANEYWPHILLEQDFPIKAPLRQTEALFLQLDIKLLYEQLKMKKQAFDPGLHTAQFQLFLTLQNTNPATTGFGDFLWFGLAFYDYRYKEVPAYMATDVGKDDATGKFIYILPSASFMQGSLKDKNWKSIKKDLYPELVKAFQTAAERGYLKGSSLEDMSVTGMNLGWEQPGTINSAVVFKNFDLLKVAR